MLLEDILEFNLYLYSSITLKLTCAGHSSLKTHQVLFSPKTIVD